jgi:lysophospholipase L1-like esterase
MLALLAATLISQTIVGDSIALSIKNRVDADVYAKVGRQPKDGLDILMKLRSSGALKDIVVIHLGTNGMIDDKQFSEALKSLRDRKEIVLVTLYADRKWIPYNNLLLRIAEYENDNVHLIDWKARARRHPEYIAQDGVHLTEEGKKELAKMINARLLRR